MVSLHRKQQQQQQQQQQNQYIRQILAQAWDIPVIIHSGILRNIGDLGNMN